MLLIAGLGNPGERYDQTRHNAGFWFVDEVARAYGGQFRPEPKFLGQTCRVTIDGRDVWLLKPTTYMNRSGSAVAALARFYKIPVEHILLVHDELDIAPGRLKYKRGGGNGGHNGLRDTQAHLGTPDFWRLRIGIGHPGHRDRVTDYVLHAPSRHERAAIDAAIDEAVAALPLIIDGAHDRATERLHRFQPPQ
ncbi:MAG: aminoacyl-tRNA hydrolase [Halothiobacillaceae bacterium]